MRDLINASLENLIRLKSSEYINISNEAHDMKDEIVPGLKKLAETDNQRNNQALVQALFESGSISTEPSCYDTDRLFELIYGVKVYESINTFLELFSYFVMFIQVLC